MSESDFDFIVIGGGSAGYAGAATASRLGLKTAVIEGGPEVGGLCILRGCMPSKTLLESGHRAEEIRHAGEFGLRAAYQGADGAAIRARKRKLIGEFADHRRGQLENGKFDFIRGEAAFVDAHTVEVRLLDGGTRTLTARTFLIATGSSIQWHDIPGLRETGCWTSDEVLDSEHIPASVVLLGGGAIALELASYYQGIGSRVTVIQRSEQVLKETDADVAEELVKALEHRGMEICRKTKLLRVERVGALKRVHFFHEGKERSIDAEEIVYALGRAPAIEKLQLARAGVKTGHHSIAADLHQRCGPTHIFAAGDVCGPVEVVHIAIQQAEIAARNAARTLGHLDGAMEKTDYRLALFAVFTDPQVAAVGLTERDARKKHKIVVAKYPFADHGKAMIHGSQHGFVKLIAERDSQQIIGASCIGPDAAELIHEIVVAMHFRATARDLMHIPHYHPTLSEIWTYPAEEIAHEINLMPP
ncbi:pyridine nucleotide-disulphide oxidoreductase dimerisation region [Chthoniobacter flavus Ellin428]|uniref:Pyridine nucleotide-disulphide oxidoreductase dimerisation region n=1 Tax=Chthoniobacter flavus Ellin428 TaxID=497964 RepID=B4D639_9BACT|nr:NAD(P)/FAD-dependent oxidoreductase [Chthoniobacter flavus]EDY18242.1 pyridine nucleotide-disulphide oxidoreductase dimerisation region [Chthoniobacter flavus Ellin428]TCO91410.1 pyruvate/2-oxoglutarate dehydrogenase complex dihydrolipoamide dehydrogenase (E3) component [Chthoniobacter flavus]